MAASSAALRASFGEAAYHEFYRDDFAPRPHYRPLWEHIRKAGQSLLSEKRREAHYALQTDGVTFTVYGDDEEGIERVWPLDLLPRIIPAAEWAPIEAGLKQRVRALNAFLRDLYGPQRVIRDGVVPAELVSAGARSRASSLPSASTCTSPASTSCATSAAATSCSKTTCARRPASRT